MDRREFFSKGSDIFTKDAIAYIDGYMRTRWSDNWYEGYDSIDDLYDRYRLTTEASPFDDYLSSAFRSAEDFLEDNYKKPEEVVASGKVNGISYKLNKRGELHLGNIKESQEYRFDDSVNSDSVFHNVVGNKVKSIWVDGKIEVVDDLRGLFRYLDNVKTVDLRRLQFSENVFSNNPNFDMEDIKCGKDILDYRMFGDCYRLEKVVFPVDFNVSKLSYVFRECSSPVLCEVGMDSYYAMGDFYSRYATYSNDTKEDVFEVSDGDKYVEIKINDGFVTDHRMWNSHSFVIPTSESLEIRDLKGPWQSVSVDKLVDVYKEQQEVLYDFYTSSSAAFDDDEQLENDKILE